MPSLVFEVADKTLVARMRLTAATGLYNGYPTAYFERCRAYDLATGTHLIFTRDTGYHSSGWWKNPLYERCYHLSLSFRDPESGAFAPFNYRLAARWVETFYGEDKRLVWEEGPYGIDGQGRKVPVEVRHYRLFCDPQWQPILPKGEVYSKQFTEKGWRSWSDVQAAELADRKRAAGASNA